jgi:hypothetical protein
VEQNSAPSARKQRIRCDQPGFDNSRLPADRLRMQNTREKWADGLRQGSLAVVGGFALWCLTTMTFGPATLYEPAEEVLRNEIEPLTRELQTNDRILDQVDSISKRSSARVEAAFAQFGLPDTTRRSAPLPAITALTASSLASRHAIATGRDSVTLAALRGLGLSVHDEWLLTSLERLLGGERRVWIARSQGAIALSDRRSSPVRDSLLVAMVRTSDEYQLDADALLANLAIVRDVYKERRRVQDEAITRARVRVRVASIQIWTARVGWVASIAVISALLNLARFGTVFPGPSLKRVEKPLDGAGAPPAPGI